MKIEKILLYTAPILFIGAMFLPGIVGDSGTMTGGYILKWGSYASYLHMYAWYANIFGPLAFAFASLKLYKTGWILSAIAFILGLQSYGLTSYPQNLSGDWVNVQYLGVGFYIWELSFLLIFIYCSLQIISLRKRSGMKAVQG